MRPENITKSCQMCGLCCRLFLINLNEEEYQSGMYETVFGSANDLNNFSKAQSCGANLLKQHKDGSCIYLKSNKCSIHNHRPAVCRDFFCMDTNEEYKGMREIVEAARARISDKS